MNDNQKNFRVLLKSMSRPGRMGCLDRCSSESPFFLFQAIAECLLDHEVSFCVIGENSQEASAVIKDKTGARTAALAEADFVFILDAAGGASILSARRGTLEFPEEGATIICCVNESRGASWQGVRVRLTGPGIKEEDGIAPEMSGIPLERLRELQMVNADYPLGVDAVFIRKEGGLMCIPRSTRIHMR